MQVPHNAGHVARNNCLILACEQFSAAYSEQKTGSTVVQACIGDAVDEIVGDMVDAPAFTVGDAGAAVGPEVGENVGEVEDVVSTDGVGAIDPADVTNMKSMCIKHTAYAGAGAQRVNCWLATVTLAEQDCDQPCNAHLRVLFLSIIMLHEYLSTTW